MNDNRKLAEQIVRDEIANGERSEYSESALNSVIRWLEETRSSFSRRGPKE